MGVTKSKGVINGTYVLPKEKESWCKGVSKRGVLKIHERAF